MINTELKPVAYRYPVIGGYGPDSYHEEDAVCNLGNIKYLTELEKQAMEPLYSIPEGHIFVKTDKLLLILESLYENTVDLLALHATHTGLGTRNDLNTAQLYAKDINAAKKLILELKASNNGKNTARGEK